MDIKDKAQKLMEDLKKPSIQTALKFLAPIILKGLKTLVIKAKEHLEAAEEAKRVATPEPTQEGQEHPETGVPETPKPATEVMTVTHINVPVAQPKEITWYPSPNYSSRRNTAIKAVVLHHTGPGGSKAALSWLTSKASGVSAHYVVDTDGKIYQLVKESDKAWHCGVSSLNGTQDVNTFSIGIEIVGDGVVAFTKEQYDSVAFICKMAKTKYSVEDKNIVGHKDIALPAGRKTDPSPFDWDTFRKMI